MKKLSLFILILLNGMAFSQTRRGLFIGINTYNPAQSLSSVPQPQQRPAPPNLNGCVNDAIAMREIMIARYGFDEKDTRLIKNEEAGRQGILDAFNQLLSQCKKGDIVFIFYAGHGSQVKNSLSKENDKKDESIVPSDSYLGQPDIRDKELAIIFQKFVDAGVTLTVIFDSCHSGSIGRNFDPNPPVSRYTSPDETDVKDGTEPPHPEERGALIFSASQDVEPAKEMKDDQGNPHGAFTSALLQVLRGINPTLSSNEIFSSVRAIMKSNGLTQEPVLAGNSTRTKENLIGIDKSKLTGKTLVAVISTKKAEIELQGGFAAGISVGSQMKRVSGKDSTILTVTRMEGVNRCFAKVDIGDKTKIKPGDMYEVLSWVNSANKLKIYIPEANIDLKTLNETVKNMVSLKNKNNINWLTDPSEKNPYQTLYYSNSQWMVGVKNQAQAVGKTIAEKDLMDKIVKDSSLFFNIPSTVSLNKSLKEKVALYSAIEVVKEPAQAQYYLMGRWNDGRIEYALVNPNASKEMNGNDNAMPLRTNFFPVGEQGEANVADSLQIYLARLAKIKGWLTLESPPDDGTYPFRFALKNHSTKKLVGNGEEIYPGDTFGFTFILDRQNEVNWDRNKRYVYVFSIEATGEMKLFYPKQGGSVENRYPLMDQNFNIYEQVNLGQPWQFRSTYTGGIDTYIMLTTDEPITDTDIFNQEGVDTRDPNEPAIMKLIKNTQSGTRGDILTPASWSIQRISVKCVPRK